MNKYEGLRPLSKERMITMFKVGYRKNEWLAVWCDENGNRCIKAFDTKEEADAFLDCRFCKIGVMTTAFYNAFVEKVISEWC